MDAIEAKVIEGARPYTEEAIKAKQLRDPFQELYAENIAMEMPFDPELWARLSTLSTRYGQLLRVYGRNVGGQGYKIVPTVEVSASSPLELKNEVLKDVETLKAFYGHPHTAQQSKLWKEESFSEILYKMAVDREAIGNGYLEVSRDLQGNPAGLWHVPGSTVRLLSNLDGFVQFSYGRSKWVYFKNFGDPRIMDSRNGQFIEGADLENVPIEYQANELIHFALYSPVSTHYGLPRVLAAELAITGNRAADERNLAFFRNDAVPRMAILVSGGSLSELSLQRLEESFAASGRGSILSHRVVLVHAQPGQNLTTPAKIDLKPLTVGDTDDASFEQYRQSNNRELREAFGLSELHLGSEGSANRASAMAILRLVNQQEFLPAIRELEYRLNATITRALGVTKAAVQLRRPKGTDPLDDAKILQRMIPAGALTPRDMRQWVEQALGIDLPPYTEPWTEIPFSLLQTIIRKELASLGGTEDKVVSSMREVIDSLKSELSSVQMGLEEVEDQWPHSND